MGLPEAARAAYQAPPPALAQALREDLVTRFVAQAPAAVRCFDEDFESDGHPRVPVVSLITSLYSRVAQGDQVGPGAKHPFGLKFEPLPTVQ